MDTRGLSEPWSQPQKIIHFRLRFWCIMLPNDLNQTTILKCWAVTLNYRVLFPQFLTFLPLDSIYLYYFIYNCYYILILPWAHNHVYLNMRKSTWESICSYSWDTYNCLDDDNPISHNSLISLGIAFVGDLRNIVAFNRFGFEHQNSNAKFLTIMI